jgi:hypothetical protein
VCVSLSALSEPPIPLSQRCLRLLERVGLAAVRLRHHRPRLQEPTPFRLAARHAVAIDAADEVALYDGTILLAPRAASWPRASRSVNWLTSRLTV